MCFRASAGRSAGFTVAVVEDDGLDDGLVVPLLVDELLGAVDDDVWPASAPLSEHALTVTNNVTESKATASAIKITFPKTLKLSTKGLPQCTKSDEALTNGGPNLCKKSVAGSGTSHVILGPATGNPTNVTFQVTPIVGKNQMLYYLNAPAINTKAVIHGKLHGSSQTISIPTTLQQPVPGLFSAIVDLHTVISLHKGTHSLVTSNGCSGGGHKIAVTETFVPNPTPPAATTATNTGIAPCKK